MHSAAVPVLQPLQVESAQLYCSSTIEPTGHGTPGGRYGEGVAGDGGLVGAEHSVVEYVPLHWNGRIVLPTPAQCPPTCPDAYTTSSEHQPHSGPPARHVGHVVYWLHGSFGARQFVVQLLLLIRPPVGWHVRLARSQSYVPTSHPRASHTIFDAEPGVPAATSWHVCVAGLHL